MSRRARWAGVMLLAACLAPALMGCEGDKKPPQVVPQPTPQPIMPIMPPSPQAGPQPQFAEVEAPPVGADDKKMNAQAASAYNQGLMAFKNGDLKQAETFFAQAVQADSEAYQAHYSLGSVRQRLGKSSALESYQRAFEIVPKYDRAIVAYGMMQARRGNLSAADSFLTRHRGKLPKSAPIAAALAEIKSLQKDTASAQSIAQEALKIDPTYAPAMMTIARDHYRNRRLDLSLYALKAILDGFGPDNPPRDKNNAGAHLLRAFIWAEQDNRPGAMEAFRTTMELRPDLVVARLRLATYLLESGGAAEALPILKKALKYDSDNVAAHLSLGDAYRLTGDYPKAKQEFDWVKTRNGNIPQVHYNLGLLYLFAPQIKGMNKKQQVEAAIASLTKFKDLQPKTDKSDVDQLLSRANLKKAEIEALEAANKPVPVPVPQPSATAQPSAEAGAGGKPPTPAPAPAPGGAAEGKAGDGG